jgi:pimeloyl-ACP methyl ester carboxylesterase
VHFVNRDGVRLAYEDHGSDNPPMLFIHGWCCDHTHFAPQVVHFSRDHRVIAVDLRGHGASDKPKQEYTMPGFADDMAWLCDQLSLDRPVVVGHSRGGWVALDLAARYADHVRAIVAIEAGLILLEDEARAIHLAVEGFGTADYRNVARNFADQMFVSTDDPIRRRQLVDSLSAAPQYVMASALSHMLAYDSAPALTRCAVPTLLINASDYPTTHLRDLCPQLVIGQTVGTGHFNQLEAPDQVNAMIERFLQVAVYRRV